MMELYTYPSKKDWPVLLKRPHTVNSDIRSTVEKILSHVRSQGNNALREYSLQYDKVALDDLAVCPGEMEMAARKISTELKDAIQLAKKNIETFHAAQLQPVNKITTVPGIQCWKEQRPIQKVGLYIPGGTAPLFSTVLMLGVPAQLAGCNEIVMVTPPGSDGSIHPAILYTAGLCGIKYIYKVGGAQAIAALAYGTSSVPKVHKIFGPGNAYVTMAKQLVQLEGTAIDMPAGPSELMVIADVSANRGFVAADLLSQAEHGADSQVILITTSEPFALHVLESVRAQKERLPRKNMIDAALAHSRIIIVRSITEAIEMANYYAPEHLSLSCRDSHVVAERINAAGSVFLGKYSAEAAGDYASGTNHVLPTGGYAAMYSGISVDSFMTQISFQRIFKEGLEQIGGAVMQMAEAEQLLAHKKAIEIRLNDK